MPATPFVPVAHARASITMLTGVSVALRTLPNPPHRIASDSFAKPACAPKAAPTGWSSEVGTQMGSSRRKRAGPQE